MVDAVAGQGQFQEGAGKARAFFDQGKQAARRNVQARERAAQQAGGFTYEPVSLVGRQHRIHRQHGSRITLGLDQPGADVQLVGAHVQNGVFQLTGQLQRVPVRTGGLDARHIGGLGAGRGLHGEGGHALGAVDLDRHVRVAQRIGFDHAVQRGQGHTLGVGRAVALGGQLERTLLHTGSKLRGLDDFVHQAPVLGLLAAHAFVGRAEDVGQVMAHLALVGHAGQAAGAGQHAQQGHFRQAHSTGAVIDQDDLVTGQGQLVAAAGTSTVHRGQELQATEAAGIF